MLSNDEKWYSVSLHLSGDNLPVEEIEATLGLEADFIAKKGELSDNARYINTFNLWASKSLTGDNVDFEEQITGLLDLLKPKMSELKKILALPEVEGELYLGFAAGNGQGGTTLSPKLLQRIAACGLTLQIELYPPDLNGKNIMAEETT
jgi:hypothetical protein